MKHVIAIALMWTWVTACLAEEGAILTLAEAQPSSTNVITATGRVQPLVNAKMGARVGGRIADFGRRADGAMLDAGMTVQAGEELFHLDTTTFDNTVASAQAALNSAQAYYDNLVAKTRPERITQLEQAIAELEARREERASDKERYERLVKTDTLPEKRLEEVNTQLRVLAAGLMIARARLMEAQAGATETEKAVAAARIEEARAMLKTAQTDLRDSVVRAPFAGLVVRRFKSPGDYVAAQPHTEVVELMSVDLLEVELKLPEAYFKLVQAGKTPVALRSAGLGQVLETKVGRVVGAVDATNGTFSVRVPISKEQREGIAPGTFVTAQVRLEIQALGVLVPLRAIIETNGQAAVFVAREGQMVRRVVEVGDRLTESGVVKGGLAPGEKVVVGPPESLKDGAPLPEYLKSK
ncbi:MAG: efflux RND transporter periplasmic adaptor subunit [Planctomycetota bacterium]